MAIIEFTLAPIETRPVRRVKRLLITAQLMVEIFKQDEWLDHQVRFIGMPKDARVVGAGTLPDGFHTFYIDVESAEFPEWHALPFSCPPLLQLNEEMFCYPPGKLAELRDAVGLA